MRARQIPAPAVAPVFEAVAKALPERCRAHPEERIVGFKFLAGRGTSGRVTFTCGCVFVVRARADTR